MWKIIKTLKCTIICFRVKCFVTCYENKVVKDYVKKMCIFLMCWLNQTRYKWLKAAFIRCSHGKQQGAIYLGSMSFVRRFICPNVHMSEGSSVRRFICPKVHLSNLSITYQERLAISLNSPPPHFLREVRRMILKNYLVLE